MKLCSSSSAKFVVFSSWVVVALVGLLLAQQVVAFTPLSSVNVHTTTRPKTTTTTTTPKAAASLTVTTTPDRTVESSSRQLVDKSSSTQQRKRQSYPHHNYRRRQQRRQGGGKYYRVQHMTSRQQQGGRVVSKGAPIVDVEPPLVQQQENQTSELVNVIGLKPKDLQPWTTLGQGTTVSGCVIVKVLPYGFLVQTNYDIPGKKSLGVALLHHRNIPAGMEQELTLGTVIDNARVIKVNRRQGTVNLSLKPARRDVFAPTPLAVGKQVKAKVVKIVPYGAFLDIGHPQRQALLHVSRMSVYKVHEITDHVQLGQTVQARIIHLSDKGDIGVSILSPENDAFVDRRQLQSKRMDLWRQVVRSADDPDDATSRKAKQELLEVDAQLWELLSGYMDTPRTSEV